MISSFLSRNSVLVLKKTISPGLYGELIAICYRNDMGYINTLREGNFDFKLNLAVYVRY